MIFEYIWIYLIRRVDVSSWLWCMDIFACNGFINPRIYNRTWHLGMGQVIHSVPPKRRIFEPGRVSLTIFDPYFHAAVVWSHDFSSFPVWIFHFLRNRQDSSQSWGLGPFAESLIWMAPMVFFSDQVFFFPGFQEVCCGGQPFLSCVCCAGTIWHCQTKHPLSSTPGYANRFINRRQGHPNLTWQA